MNVAAFLVVLPSPSGTHGNPNLNDPTPTPSSKSKQTQDTTAPQGLSSSGFSTSIHSMPCVHSDTLWRVHLWHHIQVPHTPRRRLDAWLSLPGGPERLGPHEHWAVGLIGAPRRREVKLNSQDGGDGRRGRASPGKGWVCKGSMRKVTPGAAPGSGT